MDLNNRLIKGELFQEHNNSEDNEYEWWMDVTDIAQAVFGDIVQEAKIMLHPYETEKVIRKTMNEDYHAMWEDIAEFNKIDITGSPMCITFVNSRTVKFECSEWGDVKLIK